MTVRALRGMKRMLREDPTVVVLVRTGERERALPALRAAGADLAALGAEPGSAPGRPGGDGTPRFVHGPLPIPGGLLLMVDFGEAMPLSERERLPGIVVRHLEAAGVREASVGPAPSIGRRYERLNRFVPIARAWLRGAAPAGSPPVARRPSPALAEIASGWLRAQCPDRHDLLGLVIDAEVPLTWEGHRAVVDGVLGSGGDMSLLCTDFESEAFVVTFGQFFRYGMTLGASGNPWSGIGPADRMRAQREVVREHRTALEWAGVSVHQEDRFPLIPQPYDLDAEQPSPLWYQLLSPAQCDRLGGPPPGGVRLPDGRVELTVGEPEQWFPDHPDLARTRDLARTLLRPR